MADMKIAMIVSLIDRLTAPAKKPAAAQGMVGRFGDTAQAAKGATSALRGVAGKFDKTARAARWPIFCPPPAVRRHPRSDRRRGHALPLAAR